MSEGQLNGPLDIEELSKALTNIGGMKKEEADRIAEIVLSYFGFETNVIDNTLDPDDRRLFYALHDLGILSSHWEESLIPNGRMWRIYYWELNLDNIRRMMEKKREEREHESIYDQLPSDAWEH